MERVRNLSTTGTSNPWFRRSTLVLRAINVHESIYALPFAYTGMILAARGFPTWHQFLWITVAMVSARTVGMSANRIIDRRIDGKNPRTADRHLPSGLLKVWDLAVPAAASLGVFFYAASQLNTLALALAPVAAGYIILYPYTKRFTWASNLLLGWALAIAPSAAWIGVTGSLSWQPVLLTLAVALWAGSFDVLYHTQDRDFHTKEGLHSVAQRFGVVAAFRWARGLDALATACLVALGIWMALPWPYYAGCILAAALLVYKHRLVSPEDTSRLGMAFFRTNAYVSTTMLAATLIAVLIS
jgi:4-hydroxybenzoate polyprenyltransferase